MTPWKLHFATGFGCEFVRNDAVKLREDNLYVVEDALAHGRNRNGFVDDLITDFSVAFCK